MNHVRTCSFLVVRTDPKVTHSFPVNLTLFAWSLAAIVARLDWRGMQMRRWLSCSLRRFARSSVTSNGTTHSLNNNFVQLKSRCSTQTTHLLGSMCRSGHWCHSTPKWESLNAFGDCGGCSVAWVVSSQKKLQLGQLKGVVFVGSNVCDSWYNFPKVRGVLVSSLHNMSVWHSHQGQLKLCPAKCPPRPRPSETNIMSPATQIKLYTKNTVFAPPAQNTVSASLPLVNGRGWSWGGALLSTFKCTPDRAVLRMTSFKAPSAGFRLMYVSFPSIIELYFSQVNTVRNWDNGTYNNFNAAIELYNSQESNALTPTLVIIVEWYTRTPSAKIWRW